ncbi:phosphatidylinositol-glycan-specific phospholipase D [Acrasis kona]|uniref:Phosphatidylinositol-glycan-specific phospholipase D n=1 Tax=Acrasis kona TaxID=1008807 RepID=A0AAW2Z8C8_9EUKA
MEQFESYHIGGIDDMATRTEWEWNDLVTALETDSNFTSNNNANSNHFHKYHFDTPQSEYHKAFVKRILKPKIKMTPEGGIEIHLENKHILQSIINHHQQPNNNNNALTTLFSIPKQYAYTGHSLSKILNTNHILIGSYGVSFKGSSQSGQVDLINTKNQITLSTHAGQKEYSRFGYAVSTLDINHDGHMDMIISSPSHDSKQHKYYTQGEIHIYLGSSNSSFPSKPNWKIQITFNSTLAELYMGTQLATGDLNGDGKLDLIVSCPYAHVDSKKQTGLVCVFNSSPEWNHDGSDGMEKIKSFENANYKFHGTDAHHLFGTHVLWVESQKWLMIGAPYDSSDGQIRGQGKLNVYKVIGDDYKLAFSIVGFEEFDRIGFEFDVGQPWGISNAELPILALSAITRTTKQIYESKNFLGGSVMLIDLNRLDVNSGMEFNLNDIHHAIVTQFNSDQMFSRLGFKIGFADLNHDGIDDLYMTEPYRNTQAGHASGALYVWKGSSDFPRGQVWNCSASANQSIMFNVPRSKFGSDVIAVDVDGDGKQELIVSAPRETREFRYQGAVYVVKINI